MNTTEKESLYSDLEKKDINELLRSIHAEDNKILPAVEKVIPAIEKLTTGIVERMKEGGRIFYIGAGTSGRLGILDASEIPPTYGMEPGRVIGLIAGGDHAIRNAVEGAEDDEQQAWIDLEAHDINDKDVVIGVAASGQTPYVIGGIESARKNGLLTGCITCNSGSLIAEVSEVPIEVVVGPEFVTGSTRMKAGTAQKLVLNMISTTTMIKLGRVKGNKMVDMQLANKKLVVRGTKFIMDEIDVDEAYARDLLLEHGSVRAAIDAHLK